MAPNHGVPADGERGDGRLEPEDDAIAIRLGSMVDRRRLNESAAYTFTKRGYYGISMWSLPGLTAHEIARAIQHVTKVTKGKMRYVHVRDLRQAGFMIADYRKEDGHFNVRFTGSPDGATWDTLDEIMAGPVPISEA